VFDPDKPVSVFFATCAAIDQGGYEGIGYGCGGLTWESLCSGETTFGHVMMWVLIIALIGVVFLSWAT
jgi:hypothetical protein